MTTTFAHDRTHCCCRACEAMNRSHVRRVVVDYVPKAVVAAFLLYLTGHIIVWAAKGFPGLLRIGGM